MAVIEGKKRGHRRAPREFAARSASLAVSHAVAAWTPLPQEDQDRLAIPVLKRAWGLLSLGWCQHAAWRDSKGQPGSLEGVGRPARWSLQSAIKACAPEVNWIEGEYAVRAVRRYLGENDLVRWNDHPLRTKRQVLAAVHRTVGMLLKETRPRGGWRVSSGTRPSPPLPSVQFNLFDEEGNAR